MPYCKHDQNAQRFHLHYLVWEVGVGHQNVNLVNAVAFEFAPKTAYASSSIKNKAVAIGASVVVVAALGVRTVGPQIGLGDDPVIPPSSQ